MKGNADGGARSAEWRTVRLCDVVEIDRTGVDPVKLESQVSYVGLEHLDASGGINWSETIGSAGIKSTKFRFGPDHILFGKLRPYLRKVVRPAREGVCSTDILPLLPKSGFDKGFLFHLLRTDDVIQRATQACAGANLPRLSPEKFRAFEFRVPRSLPEQKRIAAILDKADAIRRKLQQSLRLSDDFLRSVFLDMFGDPEGQGWESTTVEELASAKKGSIRTGPFGSQLLHSEFVDEGVAVLGIDNAVRNKFAWGQSSSRKRSPLLLPPTTRLPGRTLNHEVSRRFLICSTRSRT